eukprot:997204-Rhodomonas_salina.1
MIVKVGKGVVRKGRGTDADRLDTRVGIELSDAVEEEEAVEFSQSALRGDQVALGTQQPEAGSNMPYCQLGMIDQQTRNFSK